MPYISLSFYKKEAWQGKKVCMCTPLHFDSGDTFTWWEKNYKD